MNVSDIKTTRPVGSISDEDVKTISSELNELLANEYALFTKTLNYHWNITGPRFHSIHTFLEGHYKDLLAVMDDIAERVRVLGETPLSTVSEMKDNMQINESKEKNLSANDMIKNLFCDHIQIQESIKSMISNESTFNSDPGTEDFVVGLLQKHEMMSWMLKSHLNS